ncbi:hypothetical protein [Maricaulis sp.]|uniref:hypothetical protein n=1 Tax=Maricaulis sp. TaxID=1486257 RepID=UPI00262005B9|nr:hypothetical protein [Maricaulis sp.]
MMKQVFAAAVSALALSTAALAQSPNDPDSWNGSVWQARGEAAVQAGDIATARAAFRHQRALGHDSAQAAVELAGLAAREGDIELAMGWLDQAANEGFGQFEYFALQRPDIQLLMADAGFRARFFPLLGPDASQAERWRTDIAFLDRRYRQTHMAPFRHVSEANWEAAIAELTSRAATASEAEMSVGLMALMALAGDGHTRAIAPMGQSLFGIVDVPAHFSFAPLQTYWFGEELRVIGTGAGDHDLLGGRVVEIGNLPVADAEAAVRQVIAVDNQMNYPWLSPRLLSTPEVLAALGVSDHTDAVRFVIETRSGQRLERIVEARPYEDRDFNSALPDYSARVNGQPPLHLAHMGDSFHIEYLPQDSMLFVQVNAVGNVPQESFADFAARVGAALREHRPQTLVLDLRHNSGGDSDLNADLVNVIAGSEVDAPGRLYTVMGRRTFSAAINLISDMKRFTDTRLVGEPSGSSPNFVGETNMIMLPNTGMFVSASSRMHLGQQSHMRDIWWAPDLPAPPNWADYVAGRDPALEAIRAELTGRT